MSTLDDFFERVRSASPFTDNRSNGPAERPITVDEIHGQPLERLIALAREARAERRGLGAVLWGDAGIGKSHLLARLAAWAAQDKNACFVYLHNLQAGPEALPRSLLRAVISILTWGRVHQLAQTLLYRLVNAAMREALAYEEGQHYSWLDARAAFERFTTAAGAADPSHAALVDRTSYQVLFRFFRSAYLAAQDCGDEHVARLAVRWLGGEALDPAEARELGLPPSRQPDEPVALADNQQIKQVLVALSRLALSRQQPFVLCFDQVDNLDTDQAAALARFLEALIDSAPNLLVVLTGVKATLHQWQQEKVIQDSAWDRLAQFEVNLQRISPVAGQAIVDARLEHFLEPFNDLEEIQQARAGDPLFPLGQAWFDERLGSREELRPRDVINRAGEAWRRQQEQLQELGGPGWLASWDHQEPTREPPPETMSFAERVDREIEARLQEQLAQRQAQPFSLPPSAEAMAGLLASLLEKARQTPGTTEIASVRRLAAPRANGQPTYHVLVEISTGTGQNQKLGLICVGTSSATSANAILRRLVEDARPPDRVLLITEEREPLPPLGKAGKKRLDRLQERGSDAFHEVQLTFAEYAKLDALEVVLGLARAGDLEITLADGRTVPVEPREALASYARCGRLRRAPVLGQVLASAPAVPMVQSS